MTLLDTSLRVWYNGSVVEEQMEPDMKATKTTPQVFQFNVIWTDGKNSIESIKANNPNHAERRVIAQIISSQFVRETGVAPVSILPRS